MTATPRELLIDGEGRLMRRSGGDLATPDCPECCTRRRCARAILCYTTADAENVYPKVLVFPCPEDGRLCVNPPGMKLISYKGYCYKLKLNADETTLECTDTCGVDGHYSVWIENPADEFTCLAPDIDCESSPCKDPYPDPTCCVRRDLSCPPSCDCGDPPPVCDCGKRIVFTYGGTWSNTIYAPLGHGSDHLVKCRTLRYTESVMVIVTYGGNCNNPWTDKRYFGGTLREVICHGESDYCPNCDATSDWLPADWSPTCGNLRANWAMQAGLGDDCAYDYNQTCHAGTQAGRSIHQDGSKSCEWAAFSGYDRQYSSVNCELGEDTTWHWYAAATRLVECDDARPGSGRPGLWELL